MSGHVHSMSRRAQEAAALVRTSTMSDAALRRTVGPEPSMHDLLTAISDAHRMCAQELAFDTLLIQDLGYHTLAGDAAAAHKALQGASLCSRALCTCSRAAFRCPALFVLRCLFQDTICWQGGAPLAKLCKVLPSATQSYTERNIYKFPAYDLNSICWQVTPQPLAKSFKVLHSAPVCVEHSRSALRCEMVSGDCNVLDK
jgi:hypothetical protein